MFSRQQNGFIKEWVAVAGVVFLLAVGLVYYWDFNIKFFSPRSDKITSRDALQNGNAGEKYVSTALRSHSAVIRVVAENGKFVPNIFEMNHFDKIAISVTAKDKDYPFIVKDSGISYIFKKGTGTEIPISTLGVGTHTFTCGTGCSGTIRIISKDDSAE